MKNAIILIGFFALNCSAAPSSLAITLTKCEKVDLGSESFEKVKKRKSNELGKLAVT